MYRFNEEISAKNAGLSEAPLLQKRNRTSRPVIASRYEQRAAAATSDQILYLPFLVACNCNVATFDRKYKHRVCPRTYEDNLWSLTSDLRLLPTRVSYPNVE